ncbi:MAG TPA: ATP-binding protein [Planctomycetaceae bacterium]|nr:ATP-binding protein [Planctomycetaceae bacterium]
MLIERRTDRTLRIVPNAIAEPDDTRPAPQAGWRAAEAAHDLKNLLHGIRMLCEVARQQFPGECPPRGLIDQIDAAAVEAFDVCRELIPESVPENFSESTSEPIDLSDLVAEMRPVLEAYVSRQGALDCVLDDALPRFEGDPRRLRKLVLNLVKNATEALDEGSGSVRITTGVRRDQPHASVFLEVSDTGCGMDAETVVRIFDPLFTTKPTGSGVGLLSVAEAVGACGGSIELSTAPGAGTTVRALFPCAAVSERPAAPFSQPAVDDRNGCVLLVDDDRLNRILGSKLLMQAGLDVLTASTGGQTLALVAEHVHEISAVVLDITLPDIDGREVFARIRRSAPDLPVLIASGHSEARLGPTFGAEAPDGFLQKPYSMDTLAGKVREAVEQRRLHGCTVAFTGPPGDSATGRCPEPSWPRTGQAASGSSSEHTR